MAAFAYEAANEKGAISKGVIEADSASAAAAQLKSQGLLALEVTKLDANTDLGKATSPALFSKSGRLSSLELSLIVQQLAALLSAHMPLASALETLIVQQDGPKKPHSAQVLAKVRARVLEGASLAAALGEQPRDFPPLMIALVAAGEASGKLPVILEQLSNHLQQQDALKQKVFASMMYPAIVATVAVLIIIGLMTYVVPQVVGVFQSTKQALPLLTRGLVALSNFLRSYGWALIVLLFIAAWLVRRALQQPAIKARLHARALSLPLVGSLIKTAQTAQFTNTLSILLASGVPLLSALAAAQKTVTNLTMAGQIDAAGNAVREGAALSKALAKHCPSFSPLLARMAASGEAVGRLPDMLAKLALLQNQQLERTLSRITALIEPAIIVLMGAVVLVIVLAVLLPIIEINQLVR